MLNPVPKAVLDRLFNQAWSQYVHNPSDTMLEIEIFIIEQLRILGYGGSDCTQVKFGVVDIYNV